MAAPPPPSPPPPPPAGGPPPSPPPGGGGFGGFFEGLERLVRLAREVAEGAGEVRREGEFGGGSDGRVRGVWGVSFRTAVGPDGARRPVAETFGHRPPQGPEPFDDVREPIVDVFEEADAVVVVAELPGADEATVAAVLRGDVLALSAGGSRRYRREVLLPTAALDPVPAKTFNHGILELRFARRPPG